MIEIEQILEYFNKDGNMFYPKKGYICLCEGFTDDLVIYIACIDGIYSVGTPNNDFDYDPANYSLCVYEAEKVL